MRELSNKFFCGLKNVKGMLHPVLERVQNDHALMLAIRDGYINIYYRGGNILNVKEQRQGSYLASFEVKYNKAGKSMPALPKAIIAQSDSDFGLTALHASKKSWICFLQVTTNLSLNFARKKSNRKSL